MQRNDMAEIIRSCFLFSDARDQTIEDLAASSVIETHKARSLVFLAGDPADGLRVVLSGLVRIWIADSDGRELTLSLLEPGDPFGEIALLDGLPRTANATVVEPSRCLYLGSEVVDTVLDSDPAVSRRLIQLLCEILRRNTETMGAFVFQGLDGRLAQKLHELALSHGHIEDGRARLTRRFSQTDLARMLGVTREAINKRLTALTHDGMVMVEDGFFVVPDLPALATRANTEARLGGRG